MSAAVVTPPRAEWPGLLDHAAAALEGEVVFDSESLAAELRGIAQALSNQLRAEAKASEPPKSQPEFLEWIAAELSARPGLDQGIAYGLAATLNGWALLLREVAARASREKA